MAQKTASEYWKIVRDEAREKALKKASFGTRWWASLVSLGVGVSGAALFGSNLLQSIYVGMVTLGVWIVVYLAAYRIFIKNEPVLMYNNQDTDIQGYRDKWGYDEVEADGVVFSPGTDAQRRLAILTVINDETMHLDRCYAHPSMVWVKEGGKWQPRTSEANKKAIKLCWYDYGAHTEWSVLRGTPERLSVAELQHDGRIVFTHPTNNHSVTDDLSAEIYVEITVRGEMGPKHIKPKVFTGYIVRRDGTIYLERGERPIPRFTP